MKEKLREYLLENTDTLRDLVGECNAWNGSLDWLEYYDNDVEFFETFFNEKIEIARAVCYGNYNYMDSYVKFDAYGNLKSCNEWEYEQELKDYIEEIIDAVIENKDNICIYDNEVKDLIEGVKNND